MLHTRFAAFRKYIADTLLLNAIGYFNAMRPHISVSPPRLIPMENGPTSSNTLFQTALLEKVTGKFPSAALK
ncbi:MAG: hypothetical protein P9L92_16190 [Candidatus Electryonea clarkiae]|nr:hypothetical protein [Candidatus Electryonea clarkiae]MDP8287893.1 hypothetical protein [Candidatus Electryonea clarkiae]